MDGPGSVGLDRTDERVTRMKRDLVDFATDRDVARDAVDRLSTRRSPNANRLVEGTSDDERWETFLGEGRGSGDRCDLLRVALEGGENLGSSAVVEKDVLVESAKEKPRSA